LSKDYYEIGYGKPPKAYDFQKGQSGNPRGRPRKPPATVAAMIEKSLMEPVPVAIDDSQREPTGFELILLQLMKNIANGVRKAHTVMEKYEAYAKTRPGRASRRKGKATSEAASIYERLRSDNCAATVGQPNVKRPETPEERKRRQLAAKVERMMAGLEPIQIEPDMTPIEASKLYNYCLEHPQPPTRKRIRPRKGRLAASEIFDHAINSPVTTEAGGKKIKASRMERAIRVLLAKAIRGDIDSAHMLIIMHAKSEKNGDFVPK
jgi:Family of unknown function (DUF5681)